MLSVEDKDLLNIDELASYLGVKPRTVIEWRARGIGPHRIRVGRRTFFRRSDVAAWLATRESK